MRSVSAPGSGLPTISGAVLLNPVDVFVLMLIGVYAGMSAITGWDPVRALFARRETVNEGLTRPIPAAVGQTGLGGTGRLDEHRAA